MPDPTPQEILSTTPLPTPTPGAIIPNQEKPTSIGWIIFWLIGFTPVGCYMVWQKTTWSIKVKLLVITVSLLLFVGLLIESELVTAQLAGSLGL